MRAARCAGHDPPLNDERDQRTRAFGWTANCTPRSPIRARRSGWARCTSRGRVGACHRLRHYEVPGPRGMPFDLVSLDGGGWARCWQIRSAVWSRSTRRARRGSGHHAGLRLDVLAVSDRVAGLRSTPMEVAIPEADRVDRNRMLRLTPLIRRRMQAIDTENDNAGVSAQDRRVPGRSRMDSSPPTATPEAHRDPPPTALPRAAR